MFLKYNQIVTLTLILNTLIGLLCFDFKIPFQKFPKTWSYEHIWTRWEIIVKSFCLVHDNDSDISEDFIKQFNEIKLIYFHK